MATSAGKTEHLFYRTPTSGCLLFQVTYYINIMNDRLYSHLHLKNKFTLKKSPTFANLLIEKPGNWLAITKKWE